MSLKCETSSEPVHISYLVQVPPEDRQTPNHEPRTSYTHTASIRIGTDTTCTYTASIHISTYTTCNYTASIRIINVHSENTLIMRQTCTTVTYESVLTSTNLKNKSSLTLGLQSRVKSLQSSYTGFYPQNDRSDFQRGCIPRLTASRWPWRAERRPMPNRAAATCESAI